ncbi:MAG: FtsX-like permease family protein, partial [bacterium]|nr:FtsX-like permease family protein [bacterium]
LPEEDATEGSHPVAVISYETWRDRFGADPGIVGAETLINSRKFTIIGVAPPLFRSLQVGIAPAVWIPLMMDSAVSPFSSMIDKRGRSNLRLVGRLKPGVGIDQARAHMDTLAAQLAAEYPDENTGRGVRLVDTNRDRIFLGLLDDKKVNLFMTLLMSVVGLVLLIACFNVSNLLLARAAARQKEIALRLSVGASRSRIFRQLVTENVLLSLVAGGGGLLLAVWATRLIQALEPPLPVELKFDLSPDPTVLAFTFGVSVLAAVVFGAAPAIQTLRPNLFATLKDSRSSLGRSAGRARLQTGLVIAQVGLSLFLLVTAGLCVRSLQNARLTDAGFQTENLLVLNLNVSLGQYDKEQGQRFFERLMARTETLPGVQKAAVGYLLPLGTDASATGVKVDGYQPGPNERPSIYYNSVSSGYFEAMGIPVLDGRPFEQRDQKDSPLVVVVNETMAKRYWPGESAVGKTLRADGARREVIGVVKTGKYRSLGEAPEP